MPRSHSLFPSPRIGRGVRGEGLALAQEGGNIQLFSGRLALLLLGRRLLWRDRRGLRWGIGSADRLLWLRLSLWALILGWGSSISWRGVGRLVRPRDIRSDAIGGASVTSGAHGITA